MNISNYFPAAGIPAALQEYGWTNVLYLYPEGGISFSIIIKVIAYNEDVLFVLFNTSGQVQESITLCNHVSAQACIESMNETDG